MTDITNQRIIPMQEFTYTDIFDSEAKQSILSYQYSGVDKSLAYNYFCSPVA